jgi:hypothetical protein
VTSTTTRTTPSRAESRNRCAAVYHFFPAGLDELRRSHELAIDDFLLRRSSTAAPVFFPDDCNLPGLVFFTNLHGVHP